MNQNDDDRRGWSADRSAQRAARDAEAFRERLIQNSVAQVIAQAEHLTREASEREA